MKTSVKIYLVFFFFTLLLFCGEADRSIYLRKDGKLHKRILNKNFNGDTLLVKKFFAKPIEIFLPKRINYLEKVKLLIHFHGASYVPKAAVDAVNDNIILAVINLGMGSSVYEKAFFDKAVFPKLITKIDSVIQNYSSRVFHSKEIYLSSFSAGYGAIRRILQFHTNMIDGALLMDGMHTDYIPEAVEIRKGGRLNTEKIDLYLELAIKAIRSEKRFLISHSDIYPATYASNKETTDYLLQKLNLSRIFTNKTNQIGMHQTSELFLGNFIVLGFDGETAQDHVDHYHAMPHLLCNLLDCKNFSEPDYLEQ